MPKNAEIKFFKQKFTPEPKKKNTDQGPHQSCTRQRYTVILNTTGLIFGIALENQNNKQKSYSHKARTENSILKKRITQNDSHRQSARILRQESMSMAKTYKVHPIQDITAPSEM